MSLLVQYVAEVPGSGQALVLTFSTPALGMAEQLRPVFHAMASTLRFAGVATTPQFEPAEDRR